MRPSRDIIDVGGGSLWFTLSPVTGLDPTGCSPATKRPPARSLLFGGPAHVPPATSPPPPPPSARCSAPTPALLSPCCASCVSRQTVGSGSAPRCTFPADDRGRHGRCTTVKGTAAGGSLPWHHCCRSCAEAGPASKPGAAGCGAGAGEGPSSKPLELMTSGQTATGLEASSGPAVDLVGDAAVGGRHCAVAGLWHST